MQIKNFFLLAFLLAATLLAAINPPLSVSLPIPSINDGGPTCELPAPINFHAIETGPNWVKLGWIDNTPSVAYRIRIYRSSDNFLLSTTITAAGAIEATIPIPGNTTCFAKINTICEDGSHSPFEALSSPFLGLILDIVVQGYTPPSNSVSCTIDNGNLQCRYFTSAPANFRVQRHNNEGFSRDFSMTKNPTTSNHVLHLPNQSQPKFLIQADNFPPDILNRFEYEVKLIDGTVIAVFQAIGIEGTQGLVAALDCKSIEVGYEIVRLTPYNGPSSLPTNPSTLISYRDNSSSATYTQPATVSPNPFTELLDVFPGNPSAESIHLQMYNLSGQKVLDQQFAGGQEQYSLSTAGLSTGFYLLRIEADGEVQTLKVVKSE